MNELAVTTVTVPAFAVICSITDLHACILLLHTLFFLMYVSGFTQVPGARAAASCKRAVRPAAGASWLDWAYWPP
eukprot:9829139-Lingulodinium_polyedra.AAC.1